MEFTRPSKLEIVDRVKAILASKGLTLYRVSQWTRNIYGRSSLFFLPHNLYYDLGLGTFSPSLHQVFALSKISDYRLSDWLRVFGFNLEDITRMQVLLPSKRTMVLDSSLSDSESWVPWFQNRLGNLSTSASAPLGQFLDAVAPRRLRSLLHLKKNNVLYAKVGYEDAFAFPYLLPGSIVRVNTGLAKTVLPTADCKAPKPLFLVEHGKGFCCCQLQVVGKNRVVPMSGQLPYAQVELQMHEEIRILGVVDFEIRSLLKPEQARVPQDLARHWRPLSLVPEDTKLSHLFRNARSRMGLSFREASAMSRQITSKLGCEQYFVAPGSLSDYETLDRPPRHIHKAIALCAIYGLKFSTFLASVGLRSEKAGKDPIPDSFVSRKPPTTWRGRSDEVRRPRNGFLDRLLTLSEPIPFFLRESVSALSGLRNPTLHDVFWVGGAQKPLHPFLVGGVIVIVNRHKKKPVHFASKPLWQQPLYVLLRRDGTYICACCSLEKDILVVHGYSPDCQRPEQLRNHDDAEVIGEIVAIARRL